MKLNKIFITGITGYIGGTVAVRLKQKGYHVTGLVRKEADLGRLQSIGIQGVLGNVYDGEQLRSAFSGVDAVIHTADSADDAYAVDTMIGILKGSGKTFMLHPDRPSWEARKMEKPATLFSRKTFHSTQGLKWLRAC